MSITIDWPDPEKFTVIFYPVSTPRIASIGIRVTATGNSYFSEDVISSTASIDCLSAKVMELSEKLMVRLEDQAESLTELICKLRAKS